MVLADLASVAHAQHQHEQLLVLDLVHDSAVAGADSPLARAADQLGSRRVVADWG